MTPAAGALVLAGGRSTRMGTPKAALEWHGSTLLRHVAGIVGRAVDGPVVVVRAPGQALPALPASAEVTEDARDGHGPLEAIAAGLDAIGDRAEVVYVTGVDAPFLHPALVRRVIALLGPEDDIVLPRARGFAQPLAAAYRTTTVAPRLRALLAEDGHRGSRALLRRCRVAECGEAGLLADPDLAEHDPGLQSLCNLNDPADYAAARARPAPAVGVRVDGGELRPVRAATLAGAVAAVGLAAGDGVGATIAGTPVSDPLAPLASGDVVILQRHSSRSV